ncbi:MAG: response regulator [Cytophagaceae bacterium]
MKAKTILLVEDDELDVISVERSLKKIDLDISLHTAYNGIEALGKLKGDGYDKIPLPDIILLDLNMPRMNGIEFLKSLRKESDFDPVKIFVMTTSNEEKDRNETEKLGIAGYIIKPLNFNDNTKRSSSMDSFMHFQIVKILGS